MNTTSTFTHRISRSIPAALLVYAAARWLDQRNDILGDGLAWDVGHAAFLAAFVMFAPVVVIANRAIARAGRVRTAWVAGAVGLVGVGLFWWVILGDLFPRVEEIYELPDLVMNIGPLAFLVGLVTPLAVLARQSPRVVPIIAPVAAVTAFVLLAVNLDLLALAAVLFAVALWRLPAATHMALDPVRMPRLDPA